MNKDFHSEMLKWKRNEEKIYLNFIQIRTCKRRKREREKERRRKIVSFLSIYDE